MTHDEFVPGMLIACDYGATWLLLSRGVVTRGGLIEAEALLISAERGHSMGSYIHISNLFFEPDNWHVLSAP